MTGAFLRVYRDGKWRNIEIEHLTDAERAERFDCQPPSEVMKWLNMLCRTIAAIEKSAEGEK